MYTESHSFVIPHIYIGVYTHILMHINPIMIFIEMKLLEGDYRFFWNQGESQSIAFSFALEQGTCIDTE